MIETLIGQILFLATMALSGLIIQRLSGLDMSLSCLLAGVACHYLGVYTGYESGLQDHSLKELLFFIILPVLIFEAAWHIRPSLLKQWLAPILILAVPGVFLSAAVTAGLVYFLVADSAVLPWIAAALVGAILAATDPVAVTNKLKELKAPEELNTLIEGESLFNDATAVVIFSFVFAVAVGDMSVQDDYVLVSFLVVCLGGVVVGSLMGLLAAILVLLLASVASTRVVLLITAFASFYVAEHILHVSGILSVMHAAIISRVLLREQEQTFLQGTSETWAWLGLLFTSVLFAVMGHVIRFDMLLELWLPCAIVIGSVLVARIISVYFASALSRLLGYPVPPAWNILLVWGGLRGAIAIALVLSLPDNLPYRLTVQTVVFALVLFTLLVQGTTVGILVRKLGIVFKQK